MENFDFDSIEITPEEPNTSNFKLVASVSYDRQKNAFHFSKGFEKHFGANAPQMMQKQGRTAHRAQQKFSQVAASNRVIKVSALEGDNRSDQPKMQKRLSLHLDRFSK